MYNVRLRIRKIIWNINDCPVIKLLLYVPILLVMNSCAQENAFSTLSVIKEKYRLDERLAPPDGKVLLFVGQDLGAIGGLPGYSEGYMDSGLPLPTGFTSYTNTRLTGLDKTTNWNAGDVNASLLIKHPMLNTPIINIGWNLNDPNNKKEIEKQGLLLENLPGGLEKINAGLFDEKIESMAAWIKQQQVPVYLRIGFEFNAAWTKYEPKEYKAAFARIVTMLRANGVENCVFVWQSDDVSSEQSVEHLMQWYPGDQYVDWLAYSHFHSHLRGQSMLQIAKEKNLPLMLAEVAPNGYDLDMVDGEVVWQEFFEPLLNHIVENQEHIKAVAYINVDWPTQPLWKTDPYWQTTDSRVQANEFVKEQWIQALQSDSRWLLGDK